MSDLISDSTSDLISRRTAIDAIRRDADWCEQEGEGWQTERRDRDTWILEGLPSAQSERKEKMTIASHSEADIYDGCIRLMQSLVSSFCDYLDFIDIDIAELSDDEQFCVAFSPMEIVRTLFLRKTSHSGGTSTMAKCRELGIEDCGESVRFDFSEILRDMRGEEVDG